MLQIEIIKCPKMVVNFVSPCEHVHVQRSKPSLLIACQFHIHTCFLFVAKTLRDSLPAGVEPKKSRADVSFCGVSLSFTGLDREI